MTAANRKRVVLYSVVVLLVAGLAYGGFVYKADADAGTLVGSAEVLAQTGLFDKAMENARRALAQEPENRYAHIILAYCLGQVGKFDEAVSSYRRAVELSDPEDEGTDSLRLYLGEMLIQSGRPDEAIRLAESVLKVDENLGARYILAAARVAEGRFDLALDEYGKCVDLAPDDPEPLLLYAAVLEQQDRLEESLAMLDRAVLLAPKDSAVQLPRARLFASMGKEEAAVATLLGVAETHAVRMQRFLFSEDALVALRSNEQLLQACRRPIETE